VARNAVARRRPVGYIRGRDDTAANQHKEDALMGIEVSGILGLIILRA